MAITVAIFSIIAALLVALLGALVFIVFCVGFALIFLLPTLFFTTMVATFLFLFGLGAYYIVKWFNEKEIPGIHTDLKSGLQKQLLGSDEETSEADKVPALTGEGSAPAQESGSTEKPQKQQNGSAKKQGGGNPVGDVAKSSGLDTGAVGDVKKKADVGNVTKTADGVKQSIPGGVL